MDASSSFVECAGGFMDAVLWTSRVAAKMVRVSPRGSSRYSRAISMRVRMYIMRAWESRYICCCAAASRRRAAVKATRMQCFGGLEWLQKWLESL